MVNEAVMQGQFTTLIRGELLGVASEPASEVLAGVIQRETRQESAEVGSNTKSLLIKQPG